MNQIVQSPDTSQLVMFFKASADTLRLDILRVLRVESFGVLELCHIFDIPQPAMSHHLKILANAELVATRREGNSIFYRRCLIPAGEPMAGLTRAMFSAVDSTPLATITQNRVVEIHQEREIRSKAFFAKHADQFKQNQDLIAEYHHYSGCLHDLLHNEDIAASATVAEIGPGESPLLTDLAARFDRVIAMDRSQDMLDKAQQNYKGEPNRVRFTLGEPGDLEDSSCDLIAINMVLHHMASPANFFKVIKTKLKPGGCLFVVDLGPHSQDWAREVCGDLWLGFDANDLDNWAAEANFTLGQSAFLGLKNGFQVQLKLFHQP
ncbi:MAG: ArsR/SmtB family transcription factor [Pseudomonadales bacterium]